MRHQSGLISAFLDGELSRAERVSFEHHLTLCGRCVTEVEAIQNVRGTVRSLPVLDLPADLHPIEQPESRPGRGRRLVWVGAAAVAALLVAVSSMIGGVEEPDPLTLDDMSSLFGARVSLDPAFGPAKVVLPVWEQEMPGE